MEKLRLEDLEIYKLAMEIGEFSWQITEKWDYFSKKTVGGQFVRSADSIAANIAEGYGRYSFKDRRNFCYYSRGSMQETKTWAVKAKNRKLMSPEEFKLFISKLGALHPKLNGFIKSLNNNIKKG